MNNSNLSIDTELLINYAHGLLAPETASRVKQELDKDEMLRWQYEGILYLMKAYPDKDPADVLEGMGEKVADKLTLSAVTAKEKTGARAWKKWKPLAIAASVILVISIGFFMWNDRPRDPVLIAGDAIRQEYRNQAEEENVDRNDTDKVWHAAFSQGNYTHAIQELSSHPDSTLSGQEEFYYGLSYLKSSPQQLGQAEIHLQKSAGLQSDYQQDAWYYLGIIQLLKKNVEEAKKYLHRANNSRANELLEHLPR